MLFRILIIIALLSGAGHLAAQSLTERLHNVFGGGATTDEILDPAIAFVVEAKASSAQSINLQWRIEDGYYLYRDKFKFAVSEGLAKIDQNGVEIPAGKIKEDPAFGNVEINTGQLSVALPVQRRETTQSPITLEVRYQGCKEDSICYPPITRKIPLLLSAFIPSAQAATLESNNPAMDSGRLSQQDAITKKLKDGSLILNILAFFGFGLLLSLTPCVFPMIPILSGIIVGQGEKITPGKAFALSLFYVLAMALTYAVLGMIAGSFYINLQAISQTPWAIGLFSSIFVALAFSMFGFYELQLPAGIQTRLNAASDKQQGGTLSGAAVMGVLSAIIVGPCVAPPLAGALLYISQTGNALLGGLALFAMGLGFGVPLLIIGSSAGSLLPKAGIWMQAIKQVFGVIMLGVAIWFLERILPAPVSLLLWAALFIISAVFLGAMDSLETKASWQRLWKGLGIILLVYGIILVIGAASGGKSIYQPLLGLNTPAGTAVAEHRPLPFTRIKSLDDLNATLTHASEQGKYVMLDFYADWCVACKEMEEYTFTDERVRQSLENIVLLQADVTENDEQDRALLRKFDIYGPPAILFFGDDGRERLSYRIVGFVEADKFINHVIEATSP